MSVIPLFASRAARTRTLLLGAGLLVLLVSLAVVAGRFLPWVADPAALRETVAGYGSLAPLAFVLLSAASVVLAPIPGPVLALAGGYLFGWLPGLVYSMAGVTLGSMVAFAVSRRWGRRYAERVVAPDTLSRFDGVVAAHGDLALFLVFLVPGFPDDALCFLAGLTAVSGRRFLALLVLGRTPAHVLVSLAGAGLATGELALAAAVLGGLGLAAVVGYAYGETILRALGRRPPRRATRRV